MALTAVNVGLEHRLWRLSTQFAVKWQEFFSPSSPHTKDKDKDPQFAVKWQYSYDRNSLYFASTKIPVSINQSITIIIKHLKGRSKPLRPSVHPMYTG